MNHKELSLAAEFLKQCSDELSNNGCNNWECPKSWTKKEKQTFCREFHDWDKSPQEYEPDVFYIPDFAVADFLAHKLSLLAKHERKMDEVDYKECEHD